MSGGVAGRSVFDLSVSARPPAPLEGSGPPRQKTKTKAFSGRWQPLQMLVDRTRRSQRIQLSLTSLSVCRVAERVSHTHGLGRVEGGAKRAAHSWPPHLLRGHQLIRAAVGVGRVECVSAARHSGTARFIGQLVGHVCC